MTFSREIRFLLAVAALVGFLVGAAAAALVWSVGKPGPSVFGPCPVSLVVDEASGTGPRAVHPGG